jgi:TatD DNase family protein
MLGIDCHCHLEYMREPEKVIKEARKKMAGIITSVAHPMHADKTLSLTQQNKDFVFVCLGLHPTEADYTEGEVEKYIEFIKNNKKKIIGIGEIGLDYHHITDKDKIEKSKIIFSELINLANELKKPVVIHCRNAMADTLKILEQASVPVMMHFFSGSNEELQTCLERGYYISFTTMTCKSKRYRKIAKKTPLDSMLLETDAPWLDPDPPQDLINDPYSPLNLTNRPWFIHKTAEKLEKELKMPKETILKKTEENAKRLFNI